MPAGDSVRVSILTEAKNLTENVRQTEYGNPSEIYGTAAQLAKIVLGLNISAADVMMLLILIKLARQSHKHKRDNLVDICGYANLLDWELSK